MISEDLFFCFHSFTFSLHKAMFYVVNTGVLQYDYLYRIIEENVSQM